MTMIIITVLFYDFCSINVKKVGIIRFNYFLHYASISPFLHECCVEAIYFIIK